MFRWLCRCALLGFSNVRFCDVGRVFVSLFDVSDFVPTTLGVGSGLRLRHVHATCAELQVSGALQAAFPFTRCQNGDAQFATGECCAQRMHETVCLSACVVLFGRVLHVVPS